MTTARVDALVAGVKAACGYRRAVRVPASMQEVLDLAETRTVEQQGEK